MTTELTLSESRTRNAEKLRACGVAPTHQRLLIASVLFAQRQHVSADQLLEQVRRHAGRVSKATIYNTLNLFVTKGLVREIAINPDRVFYDTYTAPHHHFYNVESGELMDLPGEEGLEIKGLPQAPAGMVVDGVELIVRLRPARTH
jgi:Fur family iron response transcriptional regulator